MKTKWEMPATTKKPANKKRAINKGRINLETRKRLLLGERLGLDEFSWLPGFQIIQSVGFPVSNGSEGRVFGPSSVHTAKLLSGYNATPAYSPFALRM